MSTVNSNVDNIDNFVKTGTNKQSDRASQSFTTTFNDFLLLLTTQLQNQDPTNPMEANEFTQQIASLSAVEQQINTNKNLEKLLDMVSNTQLNNVVGYIGREIEAPGESGVLDQYGATFAYDLEKEAAAASVSITDATGKVVYTGNGTVKAGHNIVVWDGVNSLTGEKMPAGTYKIAVKAQDATGADIKSTTYTTGIVTSVESKDGKAQVSLGDIKVPIEDITTVRLPT